MVRQWYSIKAKADSHAEILIYDLIGYDPWTGEGIAAKKFVNDLKALDAATIDVRINSPGGSVFEGNTIYNALKDHAATITTYVDGVAASIASVIALAGDKVVMAPNALMMIHNPWGLAVGDANDMRKTADLLDKVRDTIVTTYEAKTGMGSDKLSAAMDAESWYSAEEAVTLGFADEVADQEADIAALAQFDVHALDRFRHVPAKLAAALRKDQDDDREGVVEPENEAGKIAPTQEHIARVADIMLT